MLGEISFDQVIDIHVDRNYMSDKCCIFQNYENSRMNRKQKLYATYKSVNDILSLFRENMPLSVVKYNNGKYYAIVKKQLEKLGAICIIFKFTKVVITLSINCHKVDLDLSLTDLDLLNLDESNIGNHLPLLPELYKDGYINL